MNTKISLPELIDQLSRKSNCTKKEAEQFLKEFFSLAADTVVQGENLKINGLGQFRLVWVEPRVSVNVRTGEPMEIPGHYKLSFAPDKTMREAVNAPFSCFVPEVLPDDAEIVQGENATMPDDVDENFSDKIVEEDYDDAGDMKCEDGVSECRREEIVTEQETTDVKEFPVSVEAELTEESGKEESAQVVNTSGNVQEKAEYEEPVKNLSEEELNALADFVLEKIVADNTTQETSGKENAREVVSKTVTATEDICTGHRENEIKEESNLSDDNVAEDAISDSGSSEEDFGEEERISLWDKMQRRPLLTGMCSVLLLLLVIAGGTVWNLNRQGITLGDAWNYYFPSEQQAVETLSVGKSALLQTDGEPLEEENNLRSTVVTETETMSGGGQVDLRSLPPLASHRLGVGDRLTLLALEYYGSKDFWVYIYEENKERMPNPNRLSVGLEVKIPDPRKYGIDAEDQQSLARAKSFAERLKEKFE